MAEHKRLWAMLALTLAFIGVYFVWDNTQFTPFVNGLRLKTLGAIVVTAAGASARVSAARAGTPYTGRNAHHACARRHGHPDPAL